LRPSANGSLSYWPSSQWYAIVALWPCMVLVSARPGRNEGAIVHHGGDLALIKAGDPQRGPHAWAIPPNLSSQSSATLVAAAQRCFENKTSHLPVAGFVLVAPSSARSRWTTRSSSRLWWSRWQSLRQPAD